MNIIINVSNLRIGGGMQVAHSFINECISIKDHEYHVFLSKEMKGILNLQLFPSNFRFYLIQNTTGSFKGRTRLSGELTNLERKINPNIVFSVFGPTYWKPQTTTHVAGFANSIYIYKNSPFFKTIGYKKRIIIRLMEVLHMRSFKKHCDVLISETEDIGNHLKIIFPDKPVFTVGNTCHQVFSNKKLWTTEIHLPEFNGFTLLTISAMYLHKNLSIIPAVVDYLVQKYSSFRFRFVLTINEEQLGNLSTVQKQHILFISKVPVSECPHLYKQANAMFLPTLLESFSANYPEAMKMEIPILTSDLPFATSLCGDAAIYFNPFGVEDIGEAIFKLANSTEKQEQLIEKGKKRLLSFPSPQQRARQYLAICEKYNLKKSNHYVQQ